jgi:hypothetical protein
MLATATATTQGTRTHAHARAHEAHFRSDLLKADSNADSKA